VEQNKSGQTFAQILRSEREWRCWTQALVAEKVETTSVNVSRWERGKSTPGLYHRQKLCEVFGLSPDEFKFTDHEPLEECEKELPVEGQSAPSTFHFNEPLLDAKEFYGRPGEWVTLRSRLLKRSSTSVVGPRRIGKSWLLTYVNLLVVRDFSERIHVCYFDTKRPSCRSVEYFLRTILNELNISVPQASFATPLVMLEYLEHIVCQKRDRQQILVLCIDEFEGLCTAPDFQLGFLEDLRALAQLGLVLITASKRPLLDIVSEVLGEQGKTSPFFNIFEQIILKPFNEYEAQKFVREKSIQAGFLQQESEKLLRYGQISSQQWLPLRLQLVGKMLEEAKHLALYEDASYYRPDDAGYWTEFEQRLEESYRGVVQ
jgi:transcriptional regulator with XRE-family HTH domain